jgi:hypothetical protein
VHNWNFFGAGTSHGQTQTHKSHHNRNLGEATTFPLIVYSVVTTGLTSKWCFVIGLLSGSPEIPTTMTPMTLGFMIMCVNFWLKWGLKKICNPCREFSNGMLHATYTQGNPGDSRLLVVENQIGNLTLDLFFGHNLCFRCPNGSCKPILDI